jgi:hypothetical protein
MVNACQSAGGLLAGSCDGDATGVVWIGPPPPPIPGGGGPVVGVTVAGVAFPPQAVSVAMAAVTAPSRRRVSCIG